MSTETPETSPLPAYINNISNTVDTVRKTANSLTQSTSDFWTTLTSDQVNPFLFYLSYFLFIALVVVFQLFFYIDNLTKNLKTPAIVLLSLFFILILIFEVICAYKVLKVFQTFLKDEEPQPNGLFFISRPTDKQSVRTSINDFITDAITESPQIKPYSPDTIYVYITKNFENALLATRVGKISGLQQDMDKILNVYPYVPVAIIVNDSIESLSGNPFLNNTSSDDS